MLIFDLIFLEVPLRVNGKVNGIVNGVKLENLDLQSYVVLDNGKAYTAISNIPDELGYDVQSLEILGGTIGWLFALPINEAQNGYQLTGGIFNHSATITFTNTSQKLIVRQRYLGLDVFDQLRMECDIQGEIPRLPVDAKTKITDYQEQHTLTAPGTVLSTSVHKYTYQDYSGSDTTQVYTIEQNFLFDYCKYEAFPVGTTWRLRVARYYIGFDNKEKIIRFSMSNKIGPLGGIKQINIKDAFFFIVVYLQMLIRVWKVEQHVVQIVLVLSKTILLNVCVILATNKFTQMVVKDVWISMNANRVFMFAMLMRNASMKWERILANVIPVMMVMDGAVDNLQVARMLDVEQTLTV